MSGEEGILKCGGQPTRTSAPPVEQTRPCHHHPESDRPEPSGVLTYNLQLTFRDSGRHDGPRGFRTEHVRRNRIP